MEKPGKMHLTVFAGAIVVFALNSSPGDSCLWLPRREPNNANRTRRARVVLYTFPAEAKNNNSISGRPRAKGKPNAPNGENMASCFRFHLSPQLSPAHKKRRKSFGGLFTLAPFSLPSSFQRRPLIPRPFLCARE